MPVEVGGEVVEADHQAIGLYFDLKPGELIDLEVAASAAIEWSRGLKAAAQALDGSYEYRVRLIAASPGSSKWRAMVERTKVEIEQSKINQGAERLKAGWQSVPLILRVAIGLAVVIPVTAKPTIEHWTNTEDLSEREVEQIEEAVRAVNNEPSVKAHRQSMYSEAQRDRNITALGGDVANDAEWKPKKTVPVEQFAEADGLFEPEVEAPLERTIPAELDVILVTPQLENAPRVWVFRQEGIAGTIRAEMKDKRFLAALDRSGIRETLRANIPMRIRLEIKQRYVDGEWKVTRRGRSVVEVVHPQTGG